MCLVCIINAEEARIQKSNLIDGEINALKDSDLARFFPPYIFPPQLNNLSAHISF